MELMDISNQCLRCLVCPSTVCHMGKNEWKKLEMPKEVGWPADRQPGFLTRRFIRFLAGTLLLNPVLTSDHLYSVRTVIKFVSLCLPLLITNLLKCQDHGK